MLSAKDNEALTRVGRGTPMGELLRRYWQPIAAVAELDETRASPSASWARTWCCTRTRAAPMACSIATARIAAPTCRTASSRTCGLRCNYHGWLFDESRPRASSSRSRTSRTPTARFKDTIQHQGLSGRGEGGAALGLPGPEARAAGAGLGPSLASTATSRSSSPRSRATGSSARRTPSTRCTSSGCTATGRLAAGRGRPRAPRHLRVGFDEFEWGYIYRRIREDTTEEDELWTVGRVCLWPNCLFTGTLRVARADRRRRTR